LSNEENIGNSESSNSASANVNSSKNRTSEKTGDAEKKQVQEKRPKRNFQPRKYYYNRNRPTEKKSAVSVVSKFQKISVLIPLFNEEESLTTLTREIVEQFEKISTNYEIFFVDDGSTDNSLNVIKNQAKSNNRIKYISFRKNYGKSAALNIGFQNVTGDAIITMDADLQDDPNEIPNLISELEKGYDLVSGWKRKRHDPFIKKYSSRFFNYVTKVMTGIKIHDFNCGLKAYRKEVVKDVDVHGELHRYIPVLADWKGYKVGEIPVKHHPRKYGKTKFGVSRFFKGFIDLVTVIFTTRYIRRPLHFFGLLGLISFLIGFLIDGYLTILWFLHRVNLSNRPILYLGTLLIIVGVQFFSLGLIGEMLVHNNNKENDYGIKEKK
jgi:glycosyltransferase involved in cell wall biosynthesis